MSLIDRLIRFAVLFIQSKNNCHCSPRASADHDGDKVKNIRLEISHMFQGDHLSGEPGNVREFDSRRGIDIDIE